LTASVEPSDETASPSAPAPDARKAAIESVVPPTTSHAAGRPHRAAAAALTDPIGAPGITTRGSLPRTTSPSAPPAAASASAASSASASASSPTSHVG